MGGDDLSVPGCQSAQADANAGIEACDLFVLILYRRCPAVQLAYRPMPDDLRGELALSMPDLAESNECTRQRQPRADSPVACTNCKNLCRRRALIALRAPATVAL